MAQNKNTPLWGIFVENLTYKPNTSYKRLR